jgi:hypothetical protein
VYTRTARNRNEEGKIMITEKTLLPEVEKFIEALDAARETWNTVTNELDDMYAGRCAYGSEAERQQWAAYECQREEYRSRFIENQDEAWDELAAADDKLVAWIGANCKGYTDEVTTILYALPATMDELDEIAAREGWCDTWGQLRDQAEDAGVLPDSTPCTPAYRALLTYLRKEFDPVTHVAREIRSLMDDLVAETQEGTALAS